jgi:hypothetical protein
MQRSKKDRYSIASSAAASSIGGTAALAIPGGHGRVAGWRCVCAA